MGRKIINIHIWCMKAISRRQEIQFCRDKLEFIKVDLRDLDENEQLWH